MGHPILPPPRLLLWRGVLGWRSGEDRAVDVRAAQHHGERDGDHHEEHGAPCGELGEQVGRAARAKGGLGALAAEGPGEIGGFALLQQHNKDQKDADDDVNYNQKSEHREFLETSEIQIQVYHWASPERAQRSRSCAQAALKG